MIEYRGRGAGEDVCASDSKKMSFSHLSVWPSEATEDICRPALVMTFFYQEVELIMVKPT